MNIKDGEREKNSPGPIEPRVFIYFLVVVDIDVFLLERIVNKYHRVLFSLDFPPHFSNAKIFHTHLSDTFSSYPLIFSLTHPVSIQILMCVHKEEDLRRESAEKRVKSCFVESREPLID
jgi:hypothetical protein